MAKLTATAPLLSSMASGAEANQILELVGFFVVGEVTETANVMNIKAFTKFIFGYGAMLARVLVAPTRRAALLTPIRTVVRRITASPIRVIFATGGMFPQPISVAAGRAKPSPRVGWGCGEFLATLLTYSLVSRGLPVGDIGDRVLGSARTGTVFTGPRLVKGELFAALRAWGRRLGVGMLEGGGALSRACLNRPRLVVGEFLAAHGARFCDVVFGGGLTPRMARTRAVSLGARKFVGEFLATSEAFSRAALTVAPTCHRAIKAFLVCIGGEFLAATNTGLNSLCSCFQCSILSCFALSSVTHAL